jgi:hypothetical protein
VGPGHQVTSFGRSFVGRRFIGQCRFGFVGCGGLLQLGQYVGQGDKVLGLLGGGQIIHGDLLRLGLPGGLGLGRRHQLLREKDGTARDHFSEQFDEAISNKSDMDMISGRKWNEANFAELNNLTKNFLHNLNPGLPAAFNAACGANQWSVSFLPVAPYGQTPQPNPGRNPQKGRPSLPHKEKLVMVPFLKMLNTDGVIR